MGCIIKGKTPHFDFIASAITKSLLDHFIEHKVPVTNGIITSFTRTQAIERSSKNRNKGQEAANAAISLLMHSLNERKLKTSCYSKNLRKN